jgi:hypothetical protein
MNSHGGNTSGGRAEDVVEGGPHPILIPFIIAPVSLTLTCTAGKGSALGHDWSIETEVVEVFDGCTRQGPFRWRD